MDWSAGLSWLAAFRNRHEEFADTDRADMGTAFGLDASIESADADAGSVAPGLPSAWDLRLAGRSRL